MKKIFCFWETVKGYDVKVLNEREIRAGSWILFLFAIIAFMNSWLVWDFIITKIFVIAFMLDFFIRIFINPKFSPSLILARFIVSNQKVEYVWATQKRFAWTIGFILAITMFYLVVLNNIVWPLNLFVCVFCLILLWFESFFWICIWCKIYYLFNKQKSKLCPWWICDNNKQEDIQKTWFSHIFIMLIFIIFIYFVSQLFVINDNKKNINTQYEVDKPIIINEPKIINKLENKQNDMWIKNIDESKMNCVFPDWVKKIGHEDKWRLHNNCK